jgi:hypothetical protein
MMIKVLRDVNFMLSKVEVFEVYTYSYSLAKSMMTVFPWLYKFTSMPFGYVCVQISRALKLLRIYVLASYSAWFRNYLQFSTVNYDVDFYRHLHNIDGCQAVFQMGVG